MKGLQKAFARTPHLLTSRVGMAKKSSDPVTDAVVQRFAGMEDHINKLVTNCTAFRDAVNNLMSSSNDFAQNFTTIFTPIGGESHYEFENKFPQAKLTIQHIGTYSASFDELRETIRPEIELIDTRIVAPVRELQEYVKKIRKTITKREHKLVDYDRHNNTWTKLREKQDKSLSDEKNMFKVEQDYELASSEYEHYNNLLQQELPMFFEMATKFISPLFHSFYYMQLNIYYVMLEKLNGFVTEAQYDLVGAGDVESIYASKTGDAPQQVQELTITKRGVSTAQLMATYRQANGSASSPLRSKAPSVASASSSRFTPPLQRKPSDTAAAGTSRVMAPPPYTRSTSSASQTGSSAAATKRAPPPPPALKPRPSYVEKAEYATAQYDFQAQSDGDLSFQVGDRIEILKKSEDQWWTGRLNGMQGVFPANYVQLT